MKNWRIATVTALTGGMLTALTMTSCFASSPEDFYRGNTIQIVVPAGPGGAFDLFSRVLAKYYPKYIPGNPNIMMQYMPGAGGAKAADYMATLAKPDGTVMSMPLAPIALAQAIGEESIQYDARKFNWIGRVSDINRVLAISNTSPIKSIDDVFHREVVVASTGRDSETYMNGAVMNSVLGAKFKAIVGFKGVADMALAMERGEVDGFFSSWAALAAPYEERIAKKQILLLVQIGNQRLAALPDVPLMVDMAHSQSDREVIEFMSRTSDIGQSLYVPPGVPADRVAALRNAFDQVVKDPDLIAEAQHLQLQVNAQPAAFVADSVDATVNAPKAAIDRFKAAIAGN
jgi:tripartite-type tricarboxylate transporter receptor subunit TctC